VRKIRWSWAEIGTRGGARMIYFYHGSYRQLHCSWSMQKRGKKILRLMNSEPCASSLPF
jgi:hypothetical protein